MIIIPIIGWLAVAGACLSQLSASLVYSLEPATGTHTVWSISQLSSVNADRVFEYETGQWVISFYSTAIATNIIATSYDISTVVSWIDFTDSCYLGILAFKFWLIHRRLSGIRTTKSRAYPIQSNNAVGYLFYLTACSSRCHSCMARLHFCRKSRPVLQQCQQEYIQEFSKRLCDSRW